MFAAGQAAVHAASGGSLLRAAVLGQASPATPRNEVEHERTRATSPSSACWMPLVHSFVLLCGKMGWSGSVIVCASTWLLSRVSCLVSLVSFGINTLRLGVMCELTY